MTRPNPTIVLLLLLTATYAAGALGAWGAGRGLETLYPSLLKPTWTPPSPIYGPVWTILDALLGFAAWRVWRSEGAKALAFALWGTALTLTAVWPWIFFGMGKLGVALGVCAALLLVLAATVAAFARRDRLAAGLVVPTLLWVAFATALNFAIFRMNATPPHVLPRIETIDPV